MSNDFSQKFNINKSVCIGVLGSARTGSSYLFSSLKETMGGNMVELGELFNPWISYERFIIDKGIKWWIADDDILESLCRKTKTRGPNTMLSALRKNPSDALRYVMDSCESVFGKKIFMVKIFDQHISDDSVGDVIDNLDGILYTKRNFFDSYISFKVAQHLNEWAFVDTSKTKINIDYDDLMWTYNTRASWERRIRETRKPVEIIEYDSFHEESRSEMQKSVELFDIFCNMCGLSKAERDYQKLEKAIQLAIDKGEILNKQNKNKNILDSIEDEYREEFKKFMERWEYDARCLRE